MCALRFQHLPLPAACAACHRKSKEGAQRPRVRGWGGGEQVSSYKAVTRTLCDPRVTHEAAQAV